jgi:hypothetical protein
MMRECQACDGTGRVPWRMCAACRATGRISERIPASDAIADAETLARNVCVGPHGESCSSLCEADASEYADSDSRVPGCIPTNHYAAAASAAFRAIPGLRG